MQPAFAHTEVECVDALVVGAGPAGLTGALYLARFRRSVLLIDGGGGRALRIPRSHNVPGYPGGVSGASLVQAMRRQAGDYGVRFVAAQVESVQPCGAQFQVVWPGGSALARTVLLATGASDIEPDMPHLEEALQRGALRYCPVCDGFEVIDRAVGLLADSGKGVAEACYLRHFTARLTLFMATVRVHLDDAVRARLRAEGIALIEAPVTALQLQDDGVTVHHGDGRTHCDALYSGLGLRVHSDLALALGAPCAPDGSLVTDAHQMTGVKGLYAAGDVSRGLNQISVAMGDAAVAAAAMHRALLPHSGARGQAGSRSRHRVSPDRPIAGT